MGGVVWGWVCAESIGKNGGAAQWHKAVWIVMSVSVAESVRGSYGVHLGCTHTSHQACSYLWCHEVCVLSLTSSAVLCLYVGLQGLISVHQHEREGAYKCVWVLVMRGLQWHKTRRPACAGQC